jgi:hypothetical protein
MCDFKSSSRPLCPKPAAILSLKKFKFVGPTFAGPKDFKAERSSTCTVPTRDIILVRL